MTREDKVAGVGRDESELERLSESSRKLIPETRRGMLKGTISDP